MKNDLIITIKPADLKTVGLTNSMSGCVIDELAFAANQWTEEDLRNNNFDYEPSEPYQFNFETDLLTNTKTDEQLAALCKKLDYIPTISAERKNSKLQAGADMALNCPESFDELLKLYTNAVKDQDQIGDIISQEYANELEAERNYFYKNMYKEWLYGDHRDYNGVVYEIAKYFTEYSDCGSYNENKDEYTFNLPLDEIKSWWKDDYTDDRFSQKAYKDYLLNQIENASAARMSKDKMNNEKRKVEREATAQYQAKQKAEAERKRIEKLKSLTN